MDTMQPLKGFRDFLPQKMAIRSEIIKRLKKVFEKYGFEELQTPTLEYAEVLLGKYGEEAEKLMYIFDDPGGRKVGLRYDLTVPLARVVASYPSLPIPFKRYQIQPAWRAENTQRGRYREFYQCDIDTIGSSSPIADAEILAIINDSLKAVGFSKYKIRINSREVLFELVKSSGIPEELKFKTIQSIDKLDKKTKEEVEKELSERNLSKEQIKSVFENIEKARPDEYLKQVIDMADSMGVADNLVFDPKLARGLDYYTGPIFETYVEEPKVGSLTGGGRYDKLLSSLGGRDLPAVGSTIGLERIVEVAEEMNLIPDIKPTPVKVLVTIFSPDFLLQSVKVASELRQKGINVELYSDENARLDKQMKYADERKIPFVIIMGPEEIATNKATLKNMFDKTQEQIDLSSLSESLS